MYTSNGGFADVTEFEHMESLLKGHQSSLDQLVLPVKPLGGGSEDVMNLSVNTCSNFELDSALEIIVLNMWTKHACSTFA